MTIFVLSAFAWGGTHAMQTLTSVATELAWHGFDPRQKQLEIFLRTISSLWIEKDESHCHILRE